MLVEMRWISEVGVRWGRDVGAGGVGGTFSGKEVVTGRTEVKEMLVVERWWRGMWRWVAEGFERRVVGREIRGRLASGFDRIAGFKCDGGWSSFTGSSGRRSH